MCAATFDVSSIATEYNVIMTTHCCGAATVELKALTFEFPPSSLAPSVTADATQGQRVELPFCSVIRQLPFTPICSQ